ncbi:ROK family protein [Paenibacillus montanisoli]|uniref:ROK family protein n=1 Tax=Paenibacillus montanisoli TaxID=2081970 RepID=A0A328UAR4_9BACL|nr:ROK family protein [Paenibacillus montanisoli]RAP78411.1 hypothetical protein DL346_08300 [Paenibacillus montanisoli]
MSNGIILKKNNVLNVIKTIKNYGPITKLDVADKTKMTAVSIHNFISELIAKEILIEYGSAESNGGRKPVLYKLNPSFGYVIGQCLTLTGIKTALFDFSMEKKVAREVSFENLSVTEVINLMTEQIKNMMADYGSEYKQCLGIGITVPGQVNPESGTINNLTNMPMWNKVSLKTMVEQEVKLPVFVENDNKATILGIKWMEEISENSCIVYVAISSGVGSGILYNGELFNGKHFSAGEIGHISVQYDGEMCNCGNKGCLELMISDKAIAARIKQELEKSESTDRIKPWLTADWNMEKVIRLGEEGHPIVMDVLKDICNYIIICIDNIVKVYDPEEIIFECSWLQAFPELLEAAAEQFFKRTHWTDRKQVRIKLNKTKDVFEIGAATLVIEDLFKLSANNKLLL